MNKRNRASLFFVCAIVVITIAVIDAFCPSENVLYYRLQYYMWAAFGVIDMIFSGIDSYQEWKKEHDRKTEGSDSQS